MKIEWNSKKLKLGDLTEYPLNPRMMTKKEFEKLVRSLKEDGYHNRIKLDYQSNMMIGGHQRKKALQVIGLKDDDLIDVLVPNRMLTTEEIDRINIRDNLHYGSFDYDILSSRFELDTLIDIGMEENMIIKYDLYEETENGSEKKEKGKDCDCSCCKH